MDIHDGELGMLLNCMMRMIDSWLSKSISVFYC